MKRLKALFMAMVLVVAMSTTVCADPVTEIESVDLTKTYQLLNEGTTSPDETFIFHIETGTVTDAAAGTVVPALKDANGNTVSSVTVAYEDTVTKDGVAKTAVLYLPEYTSVGIYTYHITEAKGSMAGVTYDDKTLVLTVTVVNGENGPIPAGVSFKNVGGTKITDGDGFLNEYKAAKTLAVKKEVSGNMGDKNKEFDVTVTFNVPEGMTTENISYTEGEDAKTVAITNGTGTVTLTPKHDETITFTNIPYGVTYSVSEKDYTDEGYAAAKYTLNNVDHGTTAVSGETVDAASESVVITNAKDSGIQTGVFLDNLPYIILLGIVIAAGAAMFMRRRLSAGRR